MRRSPSPRVAGRPAPPWRRPQLTVVTNALSIALECATDAQMKVAMTGGVVRINTLQAVGRWRSWHFRPSPWGPLSSARTASAWRLGRPPMTPAKHTPPQRWWPTPQSVVIAADGSKIGIVTFARMAGLADIHDLVTDIRAPPPPPPTRCRRIPRLRTHHTQFDPTFFVWAQKSKINTAVLIDHSSSRNSGPRPRGIPDRPA